MLFRSNNTNNNNNKNTIKTTINEDIDPLEIPTDNVNNDHINPLNRTISEEYDSDSSNNSDDIAFTTGILDDLGYYTSDESDNEENVTNNGIFTSKFQMGQGNKSKEKSDNKDNKDNKHKKREWPTFREMLTDDTVFNTNFSEIVLQLFVEMGALINDNKLLLRSLHVLQLLKLLKQYDHKDDEIKEMKSDIKSEVKPKSQSQSQSKSSLSSTSVITTNTAESQSQAQSQSQPLPAIPSLDKNSATVPSVEILTNRVPTEDNNSITTDSVTELQLEGEVPSDDQSVNGKTAGLTHGRRKLGFLSRFRH